MLKFVMIEFFNFLIMILVLKYKNNSVNCCNNTVKLNILYNLFYNQYLKLFI